MPEANIAAFNLDGKSPAELESRRREIILSMTTKYQGYDDPALPIELLQELAAITGALRRKTSGPPKVVKPRANGSKATVDDMLIP